MAAEIRLPYSVRHSGESTGFAAMSRNGWPSLAPKTATTISAFAAGSVASRWAGQSKKSGRTNPDETL